MDCVGIIFIIIFLVVVFNFSLLVMCIFGGRFLSKLINDLLKVKNNLAHRQDIEIGDTETGVKSHTMKESDSGDCGETSDAVDFGNITELLPRPTWSRHPTPEHYGPEQKRTKIRTNPYVFYTGDADGACGGGDIITVCADVHNDNEKIKNDTSDYKLTVDTKETSENYYWSLENWDLSEDTFDEDMYPPISD